MTDQDGKGLFQSLPLARPAAPPVPELAEALILPGDRIPEFILPGANAVERIQNVAEGNYDPRQMVRRLNSFIERAAGVGRSVFNGKLSYGASFGDDVDWDLFDIVSVDY